MKKGLFYITAILFVVGLSNPAAVMGTDLFDDIQIHGFLSQGFIYSDEYNYITYNSTDGSFEYSEMGINFGKQMTDKLRVGIQFFSRDLGDAANHKITVDWAYGDYRFRDWLGIRAGRIKIPFALYNEIRDVDLLRTNIIMPQGIYNDLLRDNNIALNGAGLYGNVDLKGGGGIAYQILVGSVNPDNESGFKKWADNLVLGAGELVGQVRMDTGYCGALRWDTPLPGLRLGFSQLQQTGKSSFDFGLPTLVENVTEVVDTVYSAEFTWNDLVLATEYQIVDFDRDTSGVTNKWTSEAYYISASYRFTDLFSLGTSYSVYYPDKDDKDGDNYVAISRPDHKGWIKDLALSLRFDFSDYWIFKLEGHKVNGTANVLEIDNPGSNYAEEDWYYCAAKVTFSF
jgi:hypothetical protein